MHKALIVGASGIVGGNLADRLLQDGSWDVYGVARRPLQRQDVTPIAVDIQDPEATKTALQHLQPTHIFFTTWLRQPTEAENVRVNGGMVRNVLDAISGTGSVEHVSLVTGLKHYLGPFEAYGKGNLPATPFREDQERLPLENFYYAQEDEVFRAAEREGYTWNVHRPHTIIGYAVGNAMNMGSTLAVYASLAKAQGTPMVFPGSAMQWNGLTDITDARILADQIVWAATTPEAHNQAFNIVNGDIFRWSWMWQRIADWFGVEAAPFHGEGIPLEIQLKAAAPLWQSLATKHGLQQEDFQVLASPWHTDADLGRPIEVVTDMAKSRELGFHEYQQSERSFVDLFTILRNKRMIP